jgi:arginyl-tRNA synthetase
MLVNFQKKIISEIKNSVGKYLSIEQGNVPEIKINQSKIKEFDYFFSNINQIVKTQGIKDTTLFLTEIKKIMDSCGNDFLKIEITNHSLYFKINNNACLDEILKIMDSNKLSDIFKINELKNKIIVDYPSPNICKFLHVAHLLPMIIGDALSNLYSEIGYDVLRINHIGDAGLAFGTIITYVQKNNINVTDETNIQDLYLESKKMFDSDEEFKKESHFKALELQNSDEVSEIYKLWEKLCKISKSSCEEIYRKLNIVGLTEIGESFYKKLAPAMIEELKEKNLLIEKEDGHMVVQTDIKKNNEELTSDLTIVKSNKGYTYDTTDLTAIKYRLSELMADKILYVVDTGQSMHFQQIFRSANKLGWINNGQQLFHINFGVMCGSDGKRIRSRNGDSPALTEFLEEAISETKKVMIEKNELLSDEMINSIAYGSIKYACLYSCRINDCIFSFDKMLSFKGNTLVYVMYSYVRINSVLKNVNSVLLENNKHYLDEKELIDLDHDLVKQILQIINCIEQTIEENYPHIICRYLYDLSDIVNNSYKKCRCLFFDKDDNIESYNWSRINIYCATKKIYEYIFKVLNVKSLDFM